MSRCRRLLEPQKLRLLLRTRVYATATNSHDYNATNGRKGWFALGRVAKTCLGVLTGTIATCGAVVYALDRSTVEAAYTAAHPPKYPWGFSGALSSLDHSAIRRGWLVYKTVCSACHSLEYVTFKDLVDVAYTEQEVREIAAEFEIEDGPNELGEYFTRPGKLPDHIPSPFPNEEAARAANNGAYPADLSYIVSGRHNGINYIFSLLTGYQEPPVGIELMDGQSYNAYFEGGALGMAEMLQDGLLDYDDGTPAYKSQMAKDVVEFLVWTSNQDWDTRKIFCFKGIVCCMLLFAAVYPAYRSRLALYKKTKLYFIPRIKDCNNNKP